MTQPWELHDKLVRALLDDPDRARALLRAHLPPEIVAEFDLVDLIFRQAQDEVLMLSVSKHADRT